MAESIIILAKRDDAGPAGVPVRAGVRRVLGIEAVAGALFAVLIPEIAAFPDALAQAGEGTDRGGVVSEHILRKMAGETPALQGLELGAQVR
jgi:hypothetical protein